jgi:hypothetical protein
MDLCNIEGGRDLIRVYQIVESDPRRCGAAGSVSRPLSFSPYMRKSALRIKASASKPSSGYIASPTEPPKWVISDSIERAASGCINASSAEILIGPYRFARGVTATR